MKVILVAASTLCGRISPPGLGSPADRQHLLSLRRRSEASIIGANTLRQEDPQLLDESHSTGKRLRFIVSGSGRLPRTKKIFQGNRPPTVCTSAAGAGRLSSLRDKAEIVIFPEDEPGALNLKNIYDHIAARGIETLLLEGGGKLNYGFLAARLVDEIQLTLCPKISGCRDAAALVSGPASLGNPFLNVELLSCTTTEQAELILTYRPVYGDH